MKKYQVRFTTNTKTYHKDFDTYEEAKKTANSLKSFETYNDEEIIHIAVVSQADGIEMIK